MEDHNLVRLFPLLFFNKKCIEVRQFVIYLKLMTIKYV